MKRLASCTHKKEKATRNRQPKKKNVFFTHNKEKATEKSLQGVKSDENKLNISKTLCFSTHKEEKATCNRFKGLKANKEMIILQQSNEKKSPAPAEPKENMLQQPTA